MLAKKCITLVLFMGSWIPAESSAPEHALACLPQSPYGFVFTDLGLTDQDTCDFNQLAIQKAIDYNQFDELITLEENLSRFLSGMGANDTALATRTSHCIAAIARDILRISGQEVAWFTIRAFLPTDAYDMPRWHMDGYYFTPIDQTAILYKFIMTIQGQPTMFYPVPHDQRKTIARQTINRASMQQYCKGDLIMSPLPGQGAFFMGGRTSQAALHSEPPIHESRLFFSIVPCTKNQLIELKKKVRVFTQN